MLIVYRLCMANDFETVSGIIYACDSNIDVDFQDNSSWLVPGTVDSDYNPI